MYKNRAIEIGVELKSIEYRFIRRIFSKWKKENETKNDKFQAINSIKFFFFQMYLFLCIETFIVFQTIIVS